MSVKNKCTYCKQFFDKSLMILVPVGKFCTKEHLKQYAYKQTDKLVKKVNQIEKTKHVKIKSNQLRIRKKAAVMACHTYIRLRDANQKCICCDKELGKNYHAGHFYESGNNPRIRFDEDNIHAQRLHCNVFKGGDSGEYRENLIKKIGADRVERLKSLKGGVVKITSEEYKKIEEYYKIKINGLNNKTDMV